METSELPNLYQHTKRPEWGVAILAFERATKRGYQFEDGKLRLFKEGFYHLLKPVDRPADETADLVGQLNRKLVRSQTRRNAEPLKVTKPAGGFTLEDQKEIFHLQYPDGFQDEKWLSKIRGVGASRRLKRHRDKAIIDAREMLSKEKLQQVMDDGDEYDYTIEIAKMLNRSNIVQRKKHKVLKGVTEAQAVEFIQGLHDLIHAETAYELRFERWVTMLRSFRIKGLGSWMFTTGIPALLWPQEHVCVRPSVFKKQAKWMAPQIRYEKVPSAHLYMRYLRMANMVRKRLEEAGYEPQDLIDIYDFMRLTLRPKAKKMLKKHREGTHMDKKKKKK